MGVLACLLAAVIGFERWIATTDMPSLEPEVSVTVLDREGTLLRAYTVADGLWRLPVTAAEVDRGYLVQLLAYEDKRFHAHSGVDPVALFRAVMNSALAGQVVSGASTLTMQVARLLEDAPTGSLRAKLRQIRLALALERQLPKERILDLYLTLAPFGGNIEGVRAASLSWFGKEPRRLTPAEAALLVALPQSPESRRPDRHPKAAREARDLVLGRVTARGALAADEAAAARREAVPTRRRAFPQLAPHLADRMRRGDPEANRHLTEIDAAMQGRLEDLLRTRARRLDPGLSVALLAVEHESGAVRARIGSPDLLDTTRGGFLDMTRAVRSPGSTLKPLIFGLAFEQGLAHPETLIDDRPMSFGGYDPQNFDRRYYGTVNIRTALQRSLNIPAIAALEAVGPARLLSRLRRAGAKPILPPGGVPGLAIGLGGLGMTLEDLVTVYAAMARGGEAVALQDARMPEAKTLPAAPVSVLSPEAAWYVGDILAGVAAPENAPQDAIAFKTGTSYGHRDAWAVGFDGRHTVGIWVGRPDGAAAPGTLGIDSAAPLLFEAFARLKSMPDPLGPPPKGALRVGQAELPQPLKRFRSAGTPQRRATPAPRIAFPPDGATVDLGIADGMEAPFLALKLRDGRPPFAWLVDGHPVDADPFARQVLFEPDGPGFLSISVIDAGGQAARSRVRLE